MSAWDRYTSLLRQLAVESSAEGRRVSERERDLQKISTELDGFRTTLEDHERKLGELASWLRTDLPDLDGTPDAQIAEDSTNQDYLQRGHRALERSSTQAQKAARRATRPRLFPLLPAAVRNTAVYLIIAAAALGIDLAVLSGRGVTLARLAVGKSWQLGTSVTVLIVIPLVAFGVGYLACGYLGGARVKQGSVDRSYPVGVGVLLLAFPIVLVLAALKQTS